MTSHDIQPLPLPLAQLMVRAENAKSVVDRHHNAYYLVEAAMTLAAAARVGIWLSHFFSASSPIAKQMETLVLPAFSDWRELLDVTDRELAARADHPMIGATLWEAGALEDVVNIRLFDSICSRHGIFDQGDGIQGVDSIIGLFDRIGAYRNSTMRNFTQYGPAFYDEISGPLLALGVTVASSVTIIGNSRLATSGSGDGGERSWIDLTGPEPEIGNFDDYLRDSMVAGSIFLVGDHRPIRLSPLLAYDERSGGVGFLKQVIRRTRLGSGEIDTAYRAEYMNYATGEIFGHIELAPELEALLARLRGKTRVSREEYAKATRAAMSDDDLIEEPVAEANVLGDFELMDVLGRGAMGVVSRARHRSLNRQVALKVLHPALNSDEHAVLRFKREIAALARCDHENIVHIFTSGEDRGQHFYAMEYIDGVDLHTLYERMRTESNRSLDFAMQSYGFTVEPTQWSSSGYINNILCLFASAARGLAYLHERKIFHRDIKPSNLMLTTDHQRLVITDLGLAALEDKSRLTVERDRIGTLRYTPPELIGGDVVLDARADVYSLGISLYEMLALQPAFSALSEPALLTEILKGSPTPLRKIDPTISRNISIVVSRAIDRDYTKRYANAAEFAEDLEALVKGQPLPTRRKIGRAGAKVRVVGAGVVLMGMLSVVGLLAVGGDSSLARIARETAEGIYNRYVVFPIVADQWCGTVAWKKGVLSCLETISEEQHEHMESSYAFIYDDEQRVTSVWRVNSYGFPAPMYAIEPPFQEVDDDPAGFVFSYDENGRVDRTEYRNTQNQMMYTQNAQWASNDRQAVEVWHDRNNHELAPAGQLYTRQQVEYDDLGRWTKVTYERENGKPAPNVDDGSFGHQIEYTADGSIASIVSVDSYGTAMPNKFGYVRIENIYGDDPYRPKQVNYTDANSSVLTANAAYPSVMKYSYDKWGNVQSYSMYDPSGAPLLEGNSFSGVRLDHDDHGFVVGFVFTDDEGEPMVNSDVGYCGWHAEYDMRGRRTRMEFFDESYNPMFTTAGYHALQWTYDEGGKLATTNYIGTDGEPVVIGDGYDMEKYDHVPDGAAGAGRLKSVEYFVDGKLVENEHGVAGRKFTYNDHDLVTEELWYNSSGQPAINTDLSYAIKLTKYNDDWSSKASVEYQNENKRLVDQGFARIVYHYDSHGRVRRLEKYRAGTDEVSEGVDKIYSGSGLTQEEIRGDNYSRIKVFDEFGRLKSEESTVQDVNFEDFLGTGGLGSTDRLLGTERRNKAEYVKYAPYSAKVATLDHKKWKDGEWVLDVREMRTYEGNDLIKTTYQGEKLTPTTVTSCDCASIERTYKYGRVVSITYWDDNDGEVLREPYGYSQLIMTHDELGRKTKEEYYGAKRHVRSVSYAYDGTSRRISMLVDEKYGHREHIEKNTYIPRAQGHKVMIENLKKRDGEQVVYEGYVYREESYDAYGLLQGIEYLDEEKHAAVRTFVDSERKKGEIDHSAVHYEYHLNGELSSERKIVRETSGEEVVAETLYDDRGNVIAAGKVVKPEAGELDFFWELSIHSSGNVTEVIALVPIAIANEGEKPDHFILLVERWVVGTGRSFESIRQEVYQHDPKGDIGDTLAEGPSFVRESRREGGLCRVTEVERDSQPSTRECFDGKLESDVLRFSLEYGDYDIG